MKMGKKLLMISSYLNCKKYYFLILIILLILFYLYFSIYSTQNIERFIGKKSNSNDLDDSSEKKSYKNFPPTSKYDLLNDIFGKNQPGIDDQSNLPGLNDMNKDGKGGKGDKGVKDIPVGGAKMQEQPKMELEKSDLQKSVSKLDDHKTLLGKCSFYPNKCPNGMSSAASLSGTNMNCGKNGEDAGKSAKAVAEIHSGHLSKIVLIDGGSGYNQENPPKIKIEGGSGGSGGSGASAKAEVGSNGSITSIDIIDYGYNYVETPKVTIEPPQMSGVCHLCC